MRISSVVLASLVVMGCSSGDSDSSGGNPSGSNVDLNDLSQICQQSFFDRVAGTRTGILTELPSQATNSFCQWDVTLRLERGGQYPKCSQSGTISFTGTQQVVDNTNTLVCGNAENIPAEVFTPDVAVEAIAGNELSAPRTMVFRYQAAQLPAVDASGLRYVYPFLVTEQVVIDADFNISSNSINGVLERQP